MLLIGELQHWFLGSSSQDWSGFVYATCPKPSCQGRLLLGEVEIHVRGLGDTWLAVGPALVSDCCWSNRGLKHRLQSLCPSPRYTRKRSAGSCSPFQNMHGEKTQNRISAASISLPERIGQTKSKLFVCHVQGVPFVQGGYRKTGKKTKRNLRETLRETNGNQGETKGKPRGNQGKKPRETN